MNEIENARIVEWVESWNGWVVEHVFDYSSIVGHKIFKLNINKYRKKFNLLKGWKSVVFFRNSQNSSGFPK
ncbi:hypothetical protein DRP04_13585 [Archaeoglobales archaeon]|nr:MAG: hypothetical protein DRP04_13585 [Archaeoglobales archaeon]